MRIEKIFIRNFRSIGENGLTINLSGKNLTTIVGENNVGKSSIFEAVKKILEESPQWNKEDWHAGNESKMIEIRIECVLHDEQIKEIIELLEVTELRQPHIDSVLVDSFKETFGNKLIYIYSKKIGDTRMVCTFSELSTDGRSMWTGNGGPKTPTATYDEVKSFKKDIRFFENLKNYLQNKNIQLRNVDDRRWHAVLKEGIITIDEFREKSDKSSEKVLSSPTGRKLATFLHGLKNGDSKQRKDFEKIQKYFKQFFPHLDLNSRGSSEVEIVIEKQDVESSTNFIGSGILGLLLVLAHIIAHDDKVRIVDTPETHLHPHIQRRLGSFLEESLERGQLVVITHSPYFVNLNRNSTIIRVIQKNAQTEVIELPQNYLADNDFSKLEQFLDIDTKELFFARKVLLVEGPTEIGAVPIFASHLNYNFDENGVTLINVGGKLSFEIFVKLCKGFKIPYFIIADNDATGQLANFEPKLILPSDFEAILPKDILDEAKQVIGKRKPRIGRYVAKKMIAECRDIPNEIKKIIDSVKKL